MKKVKKKSVSKKDKFIIVKSWEVSLNELRVRLPLLESEFNRLAEKWKKETGLYSTTFDKVNETYLDIISLGIKNPEVIQFILKDMQTPTGTAHWHTALKVLTNVNPIPPEFLTKNKKIKEAWIEWGRQNGKL